MVCSTGLFDFKLGNQQELTVAGVWGDDIQQDSFPVLPGPLPVSLPQEMMTPL